MSKARGLMIGMALLVSLSGCGGDVPPSRDSPAGVDAAAARADLVGWYKVTSDVSGPCGTTPKPVADILVPPFLFLDARQEGFVVRTCRSHAESDCPGSRFYDFMTPIANGWSAAGGSAFFSAGCTLVWESTQATLSGTELRIKSRRNEVVRDVPEGQCNLTAAAAVTECKYEEEIVATRL
jgi:hypothetical protein